MSWSIFIVFLGLAFFGNALEFEPEDLDALREAGQYDALAEILGVDAKFLRPDDSEERFEGSIFGNVSEFGDIMLTEEQARSAMNFRRAPLSKWPGGLIPYDISRGFSQQHRRIISLSIGNFNLRVKSVKLVPRTNEPHYVLVINGRGCWSYLGRTRGVQALSLQQNGCVQQGIVHHEFMHAAGFHHEHNRNDRDNHVQVLWNNIPREWWSQYSKVSQRDYKDFGHYDYKSVMHYPMWSPGTGRDAFALPFGVDRNWLGQRDGLSRDDVEKLNAAYWS